MMFIVDDRAMAVVFYNVNCVFLTFFFDAATFSLFF